MTLSTSIGMDIASHLTSHAPLDLVAYPQIRQQLKLAALITASIITAYLCYKVLQPFFPAVVWAVALAIVARPLHVRLVRHVKNRTVTALICVVVATLALIIPVVLITQQVISPATAVVQKVSTPEFRDVVAAKVDSTMARHPKLGPLLRQA